MLRLLKKDVPAGYAAVIGAVVAACAGIWGGQIAARETQTQTRNTFLVEMSKASRPEFCKLALTMLASDESFYNDVMPKAKHQTLGGLVSVKIESAPISGIDNLFDDLMKLRNIHEEAKKLRSAELLYLTEYEDILRKKIFDICPQKTASVEEKP